MLAKPGIFCPFYDKGSELGQTSWAKESWKQGGAPVWGWLSYDPELDLVYYSTGNPGPYNAEQRRGDNKWSSSVLARRPGDGALVWAYQFTPHDNWDYDSNAENILAEIRIDGAKVRATIETIANTYEQPAEVMQLYYRNQRLMEQVVSSVLEEQVVDSVLENAKVTPKAMKFQEVITSATHAAKPA